jgi:hypothetical protein
MDALHIPYADIEIELTMYTSTSLIHKVVLGILTPYQMVWFSVKFNIIDVTIWTDFFLSSEKNAQKPAK